jgi:hypothetical protein
MTLYIDSGSLHGVVLSLSYHANAASDALIYNYMYSSTCSSCQGVKPWVGEMVGRMILCLSCVMPFM